MGLVACTRALVVEHRGLRRKAGGVAYGQRWEFCNSDGLSAGVGVTAVMPHPRAAVCPLPGATYPYQPSRDARGKRLVTN